MNTLILNKPSHSKKRSCAKNTTLKVLLKPDEIKEKISVLDDPFCAHPEPQMTYKANERAFRGMTEQ